MTKSKIIEKEKERIAAEKVQNERFGSRAELVCGDGACNDNCCDGD